MPRLDQSREGVKAARCRLFFPGGDLNHAFSEEDVALLAKDAERGIKLGEGHVPEKLRVGVRPSMAIFRREFEGRTSGDSYRPQCAPKKKMKLTEWALLLFTIPFKNNLLPLEALDSVSSHSHPHRVINCHHSSIFHGCSCAPAT